MNPSTLNNLETDFIEFYSNYSSQSKKLVKARYLQTKSVFDFSSDSYRQYIDDLHNLYLLEYPDDTEANLLKAYQLYSLPQLFRFIGYSYSQTKTTSVIEKTSRIAANIQKHGFKAITVSLRARLGLYKPYTQSQNEFIQYVISELPTDGVIVDYGCGLSYYAYNISQQRPDVTVVLLDIDTVILEFAAFRYAKAKVKHSVIKVTSNNLYPTVPNHNLCIATEVMEHVKKPLEAFKHINQGLEVGGLLYGSFDDHRPEMFHISTDLSKLRKQIDAQYTQIQPFLYKKIK